MYMQKKYVRTLKNVLMNTTQRYYFVDGHNGDTVHVDIYITLNCLWSSNQACLLRNLNIMNVHANLI